MDIVHPIAAGIDIASKWLDVTIVIQKDSLSQPELIYRKFKSTTKGLYELKNSLEEHNCFHVCMESTGAYWLALFSVLEEAMEEVRVVNPKYVKAIKNKKDDRRDSEWIAHRYRLGMTEGSYIPAKILRTMRNLVRSRKKYIQETASHKNRRIKILRMHNVTLENVFKDLNGVSAQAIIRLILRGDFTDEEIIACINPRCKHSHEEIIEAARGIEFDEYARFQLESIERTIQFLNEEIERVSAQIKDLAAQYCQKQIELLSTIPGISRKSAEVIISEVGFDMSNFKTAQRLVSWAGLCPSCNQSGGKQISVHISKGGQNLKPVLVQCAHSAVRSSSYYKAKYLAISSRQGKKRAIIAIARKLLVSVWHMISKMCEWSPSDMKDASKPVEQKQKNAKKTLKKAISDSLELGIEKDELAVAFVTYLYGTTTET